MSKKVSENKKQSTSGKNNSFAEYFALFLYFLLFSLIIAFTCYGLEGFVNVILFFLVVFGSVMIFVGICKIASPEKLREEEYSFLEYKFLKIKGPTSFLFGLLIISGVVFYLRNEQINEYENIIKEQREENLALKDSISEIQYYKDSNIEIEKCQKVILKLRPSESISIFNGKVLIARGTGFRDVLKFKGIEGISTNNMGPFTNSYLKWTPGTQVFIKVDSAKIYGLNILNSETLEFFKL